MEDLQSQLQQVQLRETEKDEKVEQGEKEKAELREELVEARERLSQLRTKMQVLQMREQQTLNEVHLQSAMATTVEQERQELQTTNE